MTTDNHEIPGAWATPGLASDTRHARARVTAMINRFTEVSDLMVSKADLRALVALPATRQEILNQAWDVISTVRDAAPRLPNDADTGAIVDALDAAGLLAS